MSIPEFPSSSPHNCNSAAPPTVNTFMKTPVLPASQMDFPRFQRWTVIVTLVLVSTVVWLNAYESGVAKPPLFVLGGMLLYVLALSEAFRTGKLMIGLHPISLVFVAHIALFCISFVLTFDPTYSRDALLFGISCLAFFLTGALAFSTRSAVILLFRGLEWLTALLCVVGTLQLIFGDNLPVNFFVDPDRRIPSLLGNSVFFSSYLVIVFPIIVCQTLEGWNRGKHSPARYVLLVAMIVMLVATQARSSMIAWGISLLLLWFLTLRSARMRVIAVGAVLVLAVAVVTASILRPEIGRRFTHMFDISATSTFARRLYFWDAAEKAFLASPVVGHGIGRLEPMVFVYRSPDYWTVASEDIVPHAHNEVLEVAAEYGVIGLLLMGATCFLVFRRGMALVRAESGWPRWTAAGLTCAIAGVGIDNLANVSLRQPAVALLAWLFMGLLWSRALQQDPEPEYSFRVSLPARFTAIPLAAWIVFAVVYMRIEVRHIDAEVLLDREFMHPEEGIAKGLEEIKAATNEDPGNLFAWSSLIRKYIEASKWEEAVRASDTLQQQSPLYPQSSLMRAYALMQLHRPQEALEAIGRELRGRTHPLAYQIQAQAYDALGNREGERVALEQTLRGIVLSHMRVPYRNLCQRVAELSTTVGQRKEWNALLDTLAQELPEDREFLERLRRPALLSGQ